MDHRSFFDWLTDHLGPALFWGVWCLMAGWTLAVFANAIPADSAGVRLVASILGPAAGASLAVMGALRVMKETGRRERRRAINLAHATATSLRANVSALVDLGSIERTVVELMKAREALISLMELDDGALHIADTSDGAAHYRSLKLNMKAMEIMLHQLGSDKETTIMTIGASDRQRQAVIGLDRLNAQLAETCRDLDELRQKDR